MKGEIQELIYLAATLIPIYFLFMRPIREEIKGINKKLELIAEWLEDISKRD